MTNMVGVMSAKYLDVPHIPAKLLRSVTIVYSIAALDPNLFAGFLVY